ncbi:[NiFe]-hydrogenase assembly chaperone HybE [Azorhizobium doebereinerae]|uniref:[NiFe]-hydrogenase assembly chaperone HybE n=1 Tax=Azorhizobium doebereinerae TaxID=281091 RepID=UPI0004274A63|nr:[NiFe]-hydrogenase assembly chaperone HybE [Azorhizobium doebereinerae]
MSLAARFEGSYRGSAATLDPETRLECKICWHVYDPAEGCEVWQVPPGTPFTALPDHWRCPVCDGARDQFMVLDAGTPAAPPPEAEPAVDPRLIEIVRRVPPLLEAAFREIHAGQMRGVPMVNESLSVKALGFRAHEGRGLGMLITPWFMNLVLLPGPDEDWSGQPTGAKELVDFPSGTYEFLAAQRPEVGCYKACSLFSPMFDFSSQLQATETAQAALVALFDPAHREPGVPSAEIRRRREAELAAAEAARGTAQTGTAQTGKAQAGDAPAPRADADAAASDAAEAAPVPVQPVPERSRRDLIFGTVGAARAAEAS